MAAPMARISNQGLRRLRCSPPIVSQTSGRESASITCGEMPLYDCMLLLKPHVKKEALMDLVARVGKHVCRRNGVVTELKSFGEVQLGYGIKKLDGRYYQGQLMQMTMMATPNISKELHYLHKEDRLLRWLLVKHRNTKFGLEFMNDDIRNMDLNNFPRSSLFDIDRDDDNDADVDDDEDEDNDEYETSENQDGRQLT